jgi:hypothetical protein
MKNIKDDLIISPYGLCTSLQGTTISIWDNYKCICLVERGVDEVWVGKLFELNFQGVLAPKQHSKCS